VLHYTLVESKLNMPLNKKADYHMQDEKEQKEPFTTGKINLSEDTQYRIIQVKITDGIRPETDGLISHSAIQSSCRANITNKISLYGYQSH
jgi:hypothetical protein